MSQYIGIDPAKIVTERVNVGFKFKCYSLLQSWLLFILILTRKTLSDSKKGAWFLWFFFNDVNRQTV
jgi:hypothetical protein